jgi:S-adenosylmethionine:tRNA ribosyltransferase-isomerase
MLTADLDFHLPPELIAQEPTKDRPASRLLHYTRSGRSIAHRRFADLPSVLRKGDLLVFNNARVVPARFYLRKPTGGQFEGLFLSLREPRVWSVLLKNVGPWTPETVYAFDVGATPVSPDHHDAPADGRDGPRPHDIPIRILSKGEEGQFTIRVDTDEDPLALLERIGRMPLPPYIRREKFADARDEVDRVRYQTIYAKASGSVAAPTAGLHFDESVMQALDERGVERAELTLHVGIGTFKPVTADALEDHTMHVERYSIDGACCDAINRAKRGSRRVIAVGTTAARVLESQPEGQLTPRDDETGIFIYPPYRWRHVDALVTNFHLPKSTLIALVAAFVGLEEQRHLYRQAIAQRYRFFSYGDASFLE